MRKWKLGIMSATLLIIVKVITLPGSEAQSLSPTPPNFAEINLPKNEIDDSKKTTRTIPFGLTHDFGKIKYGEISSHCLSIVNTTSVPLQIVSIKANSANHLKVVMDKRKLNPNEEGKFRIIVNTKYFVGRKTTQVWVEMVYGDNTILTLIRITADSVKALNTPGKSGEIR